MALPPILPIATETYNDIWSKIDSNFLKSVESIEIPLVGIDANKIKLKLFDGTYLTGPVIPFPVTGANNGLSFLSGIVKLGGALLAGTTIDTATFNFLIQSGTTTQRLRISNTFAELSGETQLRIGTAKTALSTAALGDFLAYVSAGGVVEYRSITSTDLTSLTVVGDKIRLTFKDATYLETAGLPQGSFGSFTKNNIATATTALINVPTLILGATTAGTLVDFTHNGAGRLTYTGATTKNFKITKVSSISQNTGNNQVVGTQIYKNGVAQGAPILENQISSGQIQARTTLGVVSLSTTNYVECFAFNTSGALDLIEPYATFIIEQL